LSIFLEFLVKINKLINADAVAKNKMIENKKAASLQKQLFLYHLRD